MAINIQKLLPQSKSGALVNLKENIAKIAKPSSDILPERSLENISVIKVKVIEIDKILKGTLAAEKKELTESKKKDSSKRREKIEEKLETKPKAETGKVKMPSLPRMGFLDWIKNFIGNVILGYFAVRLIDHLPKIIPIVKFLGKATDFVLDVGGKLLDGLVTFIDWGYKAYDATRGFVKNLFGQDGAKQFDQLSSTLNQFLNLALIAGMAVAGSGGFGGKSPRTPTPKSTPKPGQGARPKVTTSGGGGAGKPDLRSPLRQRPKITGGRPQLQLPSARPKVTGAVSGRKAILSSVRPFLKRIPLPVIGALIDFGLSVALGENPGRAAFRAIGAGLLGAVGAAAGSVVPVAGNFIGGLVGGVAGDAIGGVLYDTFFGGKYSSAKSKTVKKAGGGITRSGKTQGGPKRKISSQKGKYKRKLAPKKPGKVEINSPGSDVGGEQKLFGLFPNPFKMLQEKATELMNPFKVIKKGGENLGESDYFGPILAITSKILLGQKPNQEDYKNVGLGINLLVSKGIEDGKLKGGIAAFAEGGFVDPKTLDAISQGGDISDWVARSFKEATETNAQKTLREIQDNLRLKRPGGEEKTAPSPEDMGEGGGVQVSSDSPDFWLLATAAMFENSDPQGAADVAQVIYNRTQYPAWNAPTIKKAILNPNQFQPVRQYGGTGAWEKIKTKEDAIRFSKTYGKTQEQLERVAAALLSTERQQSARQFVGPRDSFRAEAYEKANNHLANETEKTRHGHTFGFEPGGAMIGQFKAGKLSAAQVNAGVVGTVSQQGLPPLPPTGTLGGQNYGDSRRGGRRHAGQDYDAPIDGTFYSRIGGEVIYSANAGGGYGNVVDIYNKNLNITERIAEGTKNLVRVGQIVSAGTPVQHGTHQTGVFHYEIRKGRASGTGTFEGTIDPKKFLTGTSRFHGGPITKTGQLFAHKGEYVIDKDSVDLFGMNFIDSINRVENQSDLIAKAPSIIEKLKLISGYASYETEAQETIVVAMPPQMSNDNYGMEGSSSGISIMFGGGEESDPFATLYQGT